MIRDNISKTKRVLIGVLAIALLIAGYSYLSYRQHQIEERDTTMPNLSQFVDGVKKFTTADANDDSWIVMDSKASFGRLFYGLSLAVVVSFGLGILMGCKSRWEAFFLPIIQPLAKVPATGALAIFFVMVGTGVEMYIAMIFFGVMPVLAQNVCQEVKKVPIELLNKGRTLGASEAELVWDVIIPHIMPMVITSVCLQLGPAIIYLIPAEMMVGEVGFGYRIRLESKLQNMNVAYPYLAILAASGFFLEYLLKQLQEKLFPWYSDSRR